MPVSRFWATIIALCLVSSLSISRATADRCPTIGLRTGVPSQKCQNKEVSRSKLKRLAKRPDLQKAIHDGVLVQVHDTDAYVVDPKEVGEKDPDHRDLYRYAQPWTTAFLDHELSEAHRVTGDVFTIISLVRTIAYQNALKKTNDRAISGKGHKRSSHLTGATVDIRKKDLSAEALAYLRVRLVVLEEAGLIEAIEERYGEDDAGCFHVMVFKAYGDGTAAPAFGTAVASQ